MKLLKTFLLIFFITLVATGCGNKEYVGYWCKYEEKGSIILTLNDEYTAKEKANINDVIENLYGMISSTDTPSEFFGETAGSEGNANDVILIYFTDNKAIDEALIALQGLSGVKNVEKYDVKTNISLYQFTDSKHYKYQDGLNVEDKYKVTGTYKVNDKVLNLASPTTTTTLYIKDDYLCADSACNTIYTRTDANCEIIK